MEISSTILLLERKDLGSTLKGYLCGKRLHEIYRKKHNIEDVSLDHEIELLQKEVKKWDTSLSPKVSELFLFDAKKICTVSYRDYCPQ
jgi:hypothetical protein